MYGTMDPISILRTRRDNYAKWLEDTKSRKPLFDNRGYCSEKVKAIDEAIVILEREINKC